MKVALLGGSNSLYGCGIKTGISFHRTVELFNFSVGATSSMQNLACLIENKETILDADLIITESNVNDSFNQAYLSLSDDEIESIVNDYYSYLACFNKPVFCLILPLNFDKPGVIESQEAFERIRRLHLECIEKYGFFYIDFHGLLKKSNELTFDLIMPECRHPKPMLMHDSMKNVMAYFLKHIDQISSKYTLCKVDTFDFSILTSSEIASFNKLDTVVQKNSLFDVELLSLYLGMEEIKFPPDYKENSLIGVGTWCEENAPNVIFNFSDGSLIKSFNELYSFNEIIARGISNKRNIESLGLTEDLPTEKSILERAKNIDKEVLSRVGIGSFLFKSKQQSSRDFYCFHGNKQLSRVVPDVNLYSFDSNYCEKNASSSRGVNSLSDVRNIMLVASELSENNPDLALTLAKLVFKYISHDEEQKELMQKIRRRASAR